MAEITAQNPAKKNAGFSKSHHRRSTRVDLTAMVDLGFILITFFVFTSTMAQPKAMPLTEPIKGEFQPVMASNTMTIIVSEHQQVFYYYGKLLTKDATQQIVKTGLRNLRTLVLKMKKKSNPYFLMFIIKQENKSTFASHVDVLDEMTICGIPAGHYAEVDMSDDEIKAIMNTK